MNPTPERLLDELTDLLDQIEQLREATQAIIDEVAEKAYQVGELNFEGEQ